MSNENKWFNSKLIYQLVYTFSLSARHIYNWSYHKIHTILSHTTLMQDSVTQPFYTWTTTTGTSYQPPWLQKPHWRPLRLVLWPQLSKHLQVCTLSYLLINAQDPHLDVGIQIGVTVPTFYGPVRHKKKNRRKEEQKKKRKEEEEKQGDEAVWCERN